jgi:hypothetical protein
MLSPASPLSHANFQKVGQVAAAIDMAVATRTPFCFMRLGDGEGALLSFSPDAKLEDYAYLATHLGPMASLTDIIFFQKLLKSAISNSDLLGVRDDVLNADAATAASIDTRAPDFFSRFRGAFPLREAERSQLDAHGAKRIFQLWQWTSRNSDLVTDRICSPWVQIDLQLQGYWERLIASQKKIGLINSSARLAERLRTRFGIEIDFIEIPSNRIDPGQRGAPEEAESQHSAMWETIVRRIPSALNGQMFFVAAGLLGKSYCDIVKRSGGIALDIGALADAWDGRSTRTLVYLSKAPLSASQYGPPPEFQLGTPPSAKAPRSDGKRLIVHVGFSKTGTTSIQSQLAQSEAALASSRIRYVHAGRANGTDINHHQLARALGAGERPYDQPSPEPQPDLAMRLLQEMSDEIAQTDFATYVVSSELFTNFSMERSTEDLFVEWLTSQGAGVVVYVRNQFDWLISWYTQAAKNGNMGLWLDEFLANPDGLPNSERFDVNFLRKIAYFEKLLGRERVIVRSYDEAVAQNGLSDDFLNLLGAERLERNIVQSRLNQAPPDDELTGRILRRRLGLPDGNESIGVVDRDVTDRALLRGRYEERRQELREAIRSRTAVINAELERRYRIRLEI